MPCYSVIVLVTFSVLQIVPQTSEMEFSLPRFGIEKKLVHHLLDEYENLSLTDCVRECLSVKKCKSFDYNKKENSCTLNRINSTEAKEKYWKMGSNNIYFDRKDWPMVIMGSCSSEPCSLTEKCLPSVPRRCVGYCSIIGNIQNARVEAPCRTAGCVGEYNCIRSFIPSTTDVRTTCQSNGNWTDVTAVCDKVRDCQTLRRCNPNYADGEYWLTVLHGNNQNTKLKIYCADMTAGSTPKEYLTHNNLKFGAEMVNLMDCSTLTNMPYKGYHVAVPSTVEYTAASLSYKGYFEKIRIDITTLKLNLATFVARERTTCMPRYGVLTVDFNNCQMDSYTMTFDMTGTGFRINPLPDWKITEHVSQPVTVGYQDSGNKIVSVYGTISQIAGTVEPVGDIYLSVDTGEDVPKDLATFAVCD